MAPSIGEILWDLDFLGTHEPGESRDACLGLLKPCAKSALGTGLMGMLGVRGGRGWRRRRGGRAAGVPYLVVVVPGGPGVPRAVRVARLRGRAAAGGAVGTGWLRLEERQERWPMVTSALAPKSVPGVQGSGWVCTLEVEGLGKGKSLQESGCRGVPGAAWWELQWWRRHVAFWLLAAKDSLASPRRECGVSACSAPPQQPPQPLLPGEGKGSGGALLRSQSWHVLGIGGTWWDECHAWSAGMEAAGCSGGVGRAGEVEGSHSVEGRGWMVEPFQSARMWWRASG